ncbi:MAG: ATP-binding protein [Planctomycetota bacterium]
MGDDRATPDLAAAGGNPPPHPAEATRLAMLHQCSILDTDREPVFDGITQLAASICRTPIALISLVDRDRQWFKSAVGLGARQTPRDQAFCAYAILSEEPLVIEDAARDPRTRDNPLVTGEPGIRFYAGAPIRLESGDPLGTVCVIDTQPRTIDDASLAQLQVLAQQTARLLELRRDARQVEDIRGELRTILDAVPSLIFYKDNANKILNVNRAGAESMRMTVDEISGCQTEEIYPDDASAYLEDDLEVLNSGRPKLGIEESYVNAEGKRRVIRTDKIPLPNQHGEFDRLVAIATDVSELRQAETRLKEVHERLDLALRAAGQATWDWHMPDHIVAYSDTWYTMLGYEPGELPMTFEVWEELVHPSDIAVAMACMEAHLSGECDTFEANLRMRRKDGSWMWIRTIGRIVARDDEGKPLRVAGMHLDIDAEQKLQQELTSRNTELSQFAYVASHDLQEPLRSIASHLAIIQEDCGDLLPEVTRPSLEFAISGAKRMKVLIDDLLQLSRINRTGRSPEPTPLAEPLRAALASLEAAIAESGAEVEVGQLGHALADAPQITQVFQNLIGNAIKFSGDRPPRIRVSAERRASSVAVSIADEGVGFDPALSDRVFQIFQRLHTRSEYEGTGIGLAICKRVVERHGGGITVDSQPGRGTTFTFTLPACSEERHEQSSVRKAG